MLKEYMVWIERELIEQCMIVVKAEDYDKAKSIALDMSNNDDVEWSINSDWMGDNQVFACEQVYDTREA